jgi:hypothetical protein
MTPMSPSDGGNSHPDAANASTAVAKGALLIGLAVIVGVLLLHTIDTDNTKSAASGATAPPTTAKPKTTTTVKRSEGTTTTVPQAPAKTPDQLRVIVVNGGAPSGDASKMSTKLKQDHYTNQPAATDWNGHHQSGNSVLCRTGLDREAVALAVAVGSGTPAPIQPFPNPEPSFASDPPPPVDCIVAVGATG